MAPVQSKVLQNDQLWLNLFSSFFKNSKKSIFGGSLLLVILYLVKRRLRGSAPQDAQPKNEHFRKGKGNVDSVFFQRILKLLKIVFPTWKCSAMADIVLLTIFLVFRTYLSIWVAGANGRIVKAIIKLDVKVFLKRILELGMIAVPASFVNSFLEYLNKKLAIYFRSKLTSHLTEIYLKDMIFYQLTNLDNRVENPDQRMTADIEKWANSLSLIYSNFTKPVLDILLFSKKLAELVGWMGPTIVVGWYFFSGMIIKMVSPAFGKLTAQAQKLEGEYRACHTSLSHHAEEIAFYKGTSWEKARILSSFRDLITHTENIMSKRLFMGTFDSLLVKYGAVIIGYAVVGLPVFGPGHQEYLKKIGNDPSAITRDYVRNSSLLINLAKAIGRLVISYKEIQQLAGYTTIVAEISNSLEDLNQGKYQRNLITGSEVYGESVSHFGGSIINLQQGERDSTKDYIQFINLPIVTPNGDKLIKPMNITIKPGMNVVISGPNGCGKSSLFRILGELWPLFEGKLVCPPSEKLFYIPQRPYLPRGTLRDQIIYPHSKLTMLRKKVSDQDLLNLLATVQLSYIADKPGGLDRVEDWSNILAGGEKQGIAMARLFYHKPLFAILDECTSAVSLEIEALLYSHCKLLNITLFTVSHRLSLFKYHEYILRFNGKGEWEFEQFVKEPREINFEIKKEENQKEEVANPQ
ncbi:hypothetical protein ABPG74_017782 [Tetrahymena malaccensis]